MWDQSHLINLADEDARNSAKCKWAAQSIEVITRITKRFKYGTANVALFKAGRQIGRKVLQPKLWSATRFAPHASAVLRTFLNNVPSMVHPSADCVVGWTTLSASRPGPLVRRWRRARPYNTGMAIRPNHLDRWRHRVRGWHHAIWSNNGVSRPCDETIVKLSPQNWR